MAISPAFLDRWTPRALALLRIVTAYLFLLHGSAKLFGVPHVAMGMSVPGIAGILEATLACSSATCALRMSLPGIAGILEVVGGVLLILGLFTRPAAFIVSGEMAFAYFIGHASQGNTLFPLLNGGEPAVLFCFVFLFLATAGPGAWSVDGARRRAGA